MLSLVALGAAARRPYNPSMTSALAGIALAFFLSLSSLIVVLLRVSPLTAPTFALPFFFLSIFIVVASLFSLLLSFLKSLMILQPWSGGKASHPPLKTKKIIGSSLRQGVFFALASSLILFLWLLHILNWWIAVLLYVVFLLIEMALSRS